MKLLKSMLKKLSRPRVIAVIILFVLVIAGGIFFWLRQSLPAQEEAARYLESSEQVEVVRGDDVIEFWPRSRENYDSGIIFYPGAQVEAEAYAALASILAEAGYPVFLVEMPFQLSILGWDRAEDIMAANRENISSWTMAGHSLGGAMSARFVSREQPPAVENLLLLAAYPAAGEDLSQKKISVLSIYGSEDEIINLERLQERTSLLPADARMKTLEGANHAGFGQYGEQEGDGEAKISGEEQRQMAVQIILEFLE